MDKKLLKTRMKEYLATIGAELSVFKGHQPAAYQQLISQFDHGSISGMMMPLGWSKLSENSATNSAPNVILNIAHIRGQNFRLFQLMPGIVKTLQIERVSKDDWNISDEEVRHTK